MSEKKGFVTEVADIFEDGWMCRRDGQKFIDDVIAENIKYALERDDGFKEFIGNVRFSVIIPPGAYTTIRCVDNLYQYEFEVFDTTNDKVIAHGTAYGRIECDLEKYNETGDECDILVKLIDMVVEVKKAGSNER